MPTAQTYQSEFTGSQMDARLAAVAQLTAALEALTTVVAQKYVKPASGIPSTDMDADVQAALAKANTAVQSLADYYTKSEVDQLLAAINGMDYVDVATLPTASASTLGKIYLVGPDASGYYAYYYTSYDGSAYSWVGPLGTTQISLANYATKAELSQLDQEVGELDAEINGVDEVAIDFSAEILEYGYIDNSPASGWAGRSAPGHYMLRVVPGAVFTFTANPTAAFGQFAILKERPTYDYGAHNAPSTRPVYSTAEGFTTLVSVVKNTARTFTIPPDGAYLYIRYQGNLMPASLITPGIEGLTEIVGKIGERIDAAAYDFLPFDATELDVVFHRGKCSAGAPENTVQALFQCAMIGAKMVECDLKTTADGVPVLMHDVSINRTMMNVDGTDISDTVKVYENTYATLAANYVYKSSVQKWRTPICTFAEWLDACKKLHIVPFFDLDSMDATRYAMIKKAVGENFIFMSGLSGCRAMRQFSKECFVWLKNSSSDEDGIIEELKSIGGRCGYSSMSIATFTSTFREKLASNGFFWQMSVSTGVESSAVSRGCKSILTDGTWCGNNEISNPLYALAPDCSNITATVEDGEIVVAPNGSITLPLTHTGKRNLRCVLTMKGKFSMVLGGTTAEPVDVDDYTIVQLGRNLQTDSDNLVITNTGVVDGYIKELFVFTE